MYLPMIEASKS